MSPQQGVAVSNRGGKRHSVLISHVRLQTVALAGAVRQPKGRRGIRLEREKSLCTGDTILRVEDPMEPAAKSQ